MEILEILKVFENVESGSMEATRDMVSLTYVIHGSIHSDGYYVETWERILRSLPGHDGVLTVAHLLRPFHVFREVILRDGGDTDCHPYQSINELADIYAAFQPDKPQSYYHC